MIVLFLILGLIMGSFYMVVAMRGSMGKSIVKPGSHCEYCQHYLKWYELIPVISYIIFKGKCHNCHHKLSIWYPIIELLSGVLFALGYYLYGLSYELMAYLIIASLLIIIFISDFKFMIILDLPLFIGILLIVILKFIYFGYVAGFKAIISGLFIFIFMYIVKIIGDKIFKRESLGGGDIKLGAFMGCALGIRLGLTSLVIGSFIALPYATYYVLKKKDKEIPYGPFLILAVLICFIFMAPINDIINALFIIS